jgi:ferredoxin
MQVMWGLPGLLDARVADAVTASCALPGIFPPREIGGRAYVDGAVIENLPVRLAASLGSGPIIAVNVAATSIRREAHETEGFAATYIRGLDKTPELIEAGYRATAQTLDQLDGQLHLIERGMHPTRRLRVLVDDKRCVGCGTCVVQAPKVFRLDARGKAEVTTPVQTWSPLQGSYVLNCPTDAISVHPEGTAA